GLEPDRLPGERPSGGGDGRLEAGAMGALRELFGRTRLVELDPPGAGLHLRGIADLVRDRSTGLLERGPSILPDPRISERDLDVDLRHLRLSNLELRKVGPEDLVLRL